MIDWVEGNTNPVRLNATVTEGPYTGEIQKLCSWPLRPLWRDEENFECVYDQASIDTWTYTFDAYDEVVY
jgi:tannase